MGKAGRVVSEETKRKISAAWARKRAAKEAVANGTNHDSLTTVKITLPKATSVMINNIASLTGTKPEMVAGAILSKAVHQSKMK